MIDILLVFSIGVFSAFFGALVGGAGFVSIPFLLFVGLPPHTAIGTNALGAMGLSIGGFARFWRGGRVAWSYIPSFIVLGVIGSFLGANIVLRVNGQLLIKLVALLILFILPLVLFNQSIGNDTQLVGKRRKFLGFIVYFLVMIYSGFLSAGSGTLIFYTYMIFFGLTFIDSAATSKLPAIFSSFVVFLTFASNRAVDYKLGAVLFLGMLVGAYWGAHAGLLKGNQWVKKLFTIVVLVSAIKLLLF